MLRNRNLKGWIPVALFMALGFLLLLPTAALAQQATATILGTVTDPQGAVIPGASVTAINTDTAFTRTVPSGSDGAYRIPNLAVGNYELRVTKDGFETNDRKGLVLEVGQEAVINVAMTVGTTSQTVEVTSAQAPLIDTTTASVGNVVDEQKVADLPLNGRNWANLTLLQPGIAQSFRTSPSPTSNGGGFGGAGTVFISNGTGARSNNYMIDGALMQTMYGFNGAAVSGNSLGIDGIQEFKVLTGLFDAEYPLTAGSQTVIASKSGTNAYHGDAFEYLRNSSLDARNYFDTLDTGNVRGFGTDKSPAFPDKRLPPYHRSDFGGSFGGPIRKDKTFFYAVFERLDEHKGLSTATETLPAGCFSGGTFIGLTNTSIPAACYSPSTPTAPNITMTAPIQELLTQSDSGGALNPTVFPNGDIFPAPNVSGSNAFNYSFPAIQLTGENYGQLRFDQNFSQKDSAFIRYTEDQDTQDIPDNYLFAHTPQSSLAWYVTASESHVFSPTFLQTLRFSYSLTHITNQTVGIPGANEKSLVFQRGVGTVTPGSGVAGLGITTPAAYNQRIFTTSDDYIWTKGKHSFKIGTLWNHFENPNAGSVLDYNGSISFATLAQFFAGQYSSIVEMPSNTDLRRSLSYNTLGFYAQDDYRVLSRVTLNLGLRYEFATTPNGPNVFSIPNLLTAGPPNFGTQGPPFSAASTHHNFSPRVGFAWDVRGDGKTAVRGGGGIYYDMGTFGGRFIQGNYDSLPHTWDYSFNNPALNPLLVAPVGSGMIDPLSSTRSGCGQITFPNFLPCNIGQVEYNIGQPSYGQWNLTIDQQLPGQMALSVTYLGSVGWSLESEIDQAYVDATIDSGGSYIPLQTDSRGEPMYCVQAANGTCAFSQNAAVTSTAAANAINGLAFKRLNPNVGATSYELTNARSWYHSLQVVVNKRLSNGLQFQSSFTWSKLMDDSAEGLLGDTATTTIVPTGPNLSTLKLNNGPSVYNIPLNWRFNAIYHFKTLGGDGILTKFTDGWWTGAILTAQSGYPFEPTISGGNRMLATPQIGSDIPNRAASFNAGSVIVGKVSQWFNPTMFALQSAGVDGNEGRDFLSGPGLAELDWSFNKDTKAAFLGEAGEIQFRAEIFNILNRANFNLPSTGVFSLPAGATQASLAPGQFVPAGTLLSNGQPNPYSALSTAGTISSTVTTSRQIQFALKLVF